MTQLFLKEALTINQKIYQWIPWQLKYIIQDSALEYNYIFVSFTVISP